jgi:nicotinamide riboside transporter PnuC
MLSQNMDNFFAGLLFIFTVLGLLLVSLKNKWGFVIGLIGQLLFLTAAYFDKMRGLVILSIVLILIWIFGIYNWFYLT